MVGGKPKSLFHMDDDDYLAKVEAQEKEDEEKNSTEAGKKASDSAVGAEQLQKDERERDRKSNKK